MIGALIGLETLLGLSWVFLIFDGPFALSILAMAAGLLLVLVAVAMRAGEARQAWSAARILALPLALYIVFVVAQCVPIPGIANAMWSAAATALNESIAGVVTIDLGATVLALLQFLGLTALAFVALCVAVNRQRAEPLLRVLVVLAAALSLALLVASIVAPGAIASSGKGQTPLIAVASLGVLLSTASVLRSLERLELSRGKGAAGFSQPYSGLALSGAALAICAGIIAIAGYERAGWALLCAWLPVAALWICRRVRGRKSVMRATLAVVNVLMVALFASRMLGSAEAILHNSVSPASPQSGLWQRMQADTPLLGTGAGTYSSLVPIYRTFADASGDLTAPTTAAALAVGIGWPAMLALAVIGLACGFVLLDRALQRGRDSFYPAVGGGCLILGCFTMFVDNSLLGTTVATMFVVIVGLAFGQSLSTRQMLE